MRFKVNIKVKWATFDRDIIKTRWKRFNRHPLTKAGNLVRTIARGSIRRRKNRNLHSPRGMPPYSHANGKTPPFKMIYSVPNMPSLFTSSVTVGMVGFGGTVPVPGLHEHGGFAIRTVFRPGSPGPRGGKRRRRVRASVHYHKRWFMMPALKKAKPKFAKFWKGSFNRVR